MPDKAQDSINDIRYTLREFVTDTFLATAGMDTFEDADSFMDTGIIDSTGVLELLEFIEEKFNIKIEDEEIIPDNLDSLNNVTSFIEKKVGYAR